MVIGVRFTLARSLRSATIAGGAVLTLAAGGALHLADHPQQGDNAWIAGIVVVMLGEIWPTLRATLHRSLGVNVIALLAMAVPWRSGSPSPAPWSRS